jgi:hypothetical protein
VPATANGTLKSTTGTASTTLALTATSAIGDLRVFYSKVNSGTITVSALSGGDCPASGSGSPGQWTRVAGPSVDTASPVGTHEMWIGVCSGVGATTITITWSASVTGLAIDLDCQTFSFGNASTLWNRDGTQSNFQNNASSTTITYPSLTAQNGAELYVGHSRNPTGGTYGTPTGGGFTWSTQTDANGNTFIYSLSTGPGTVAPTQSSVATLSYTIGALIIVSPPPNLRRRGGLRQAVNRSATY